MSNKDRTTLVSTCVTKWKASVISGYFFTPNALVYYVSKFFDVSPLPNEADFSMSVYFANTIVVFEFAILMYVYRNN